MMHLITLLSKCCTLKMPTNTCLEGSCRNTCVHAFRHCNALMNPSSLFLTSNWDFALVQAVCKNYRRFLFPYSILFPTLSFSILLVVNQKSVSVCLLSSTCISGTETSYIVAEHRTQHVTLQLHWVLVSAGF